MGIDQIPVGKVYVSPGRTISEGEFGILHGLVWVAHRTHTDKEFMKTHLHGERILLGGLVVAIMIGLEEQTDWRRDVEAAGYLGVALLGIDKVRFKKPVQPGDTIHVRTQITEVRESKSNPRRIIFSRKTEALNQRGEQCAEFIATPMFEKVEG